MVIYISKNQIMDLVRQSTLQVLPFLGAEEINASSCMKDLGANSIDRVEILTGVLENMNMEVSLLEFSGANSVGDLVEKLHAKLCEFR